MLATGFTIRQLRNIITKDHVFILIWGIITGVISGLTSTLYSLRSGSDMPWNIIAVMIILILAAGITAIFISIRTVKSSALIVQLRRE
jgi:ABC-type antimicrobial peptide transport system permease subunit